MLADMTCGSESGMRIVESDSVGVEASEANQTPHKIVIWKTQIWKGGDFHISLGFSNQSSSTSCP